MGSVPAFTFVLVFMASSFPFDLLLVSLAFEQCKPCANGQRASNLSPQFRK
jgi:hypothetical protein